MNYETAAQQWEEEMMRLLLASGISPAALFGGANPDADAAEVEAKIRKSDNEVALAEEELDAKLRELGLDPEKLRAQHPPDPPLPVPSVPEDPEEAIEALEAQVAQSETEFQAKLRELGLDPERLRSQNPPDLPSSVVSLPEDPEESLRALGAQGAQSESAFLDEIRKLGIDPEKLDLKG